MTCIQLVKVGGDGVHSESDRVVEGRCFITAYDRSGASDDRLDWRSLVVERTLALEPMSVARILAMTSKSDSVSVLQVRVRERGGGGGGGCLPTSS